LIPDSTTLQNVWSYSPSRSGFFGGGINGSLTFAERKEMSNILDGGEGFGGGNTDLTEFPEGLAYLPAVAFDLRGGWRGFDIGLTGMYISTELLSESKTILGEDSVFTYGTFGIDVRYTFFGDGRFFKTFPRQSNTILNFLPNMTLLGGYYFTFSNFEFASAGSEKVNINFRNDSYVIALQLSKQFGLTGFSLIPFGGGKMIISKTDSDFSWQTERPVRVSSQEFGDGLTYHSGTNSGDHKTYFQLYGGIGINFLMLDVTLGVAYNVVTEHFGINLGARFLFGGGM